MKGQRRCAVVVALICALWPATAALATAGDLGIQDQSYSGGTRVTREMAESKLWWNDGYWWASMLVSKSAGHHIFRLDNPAVASWVDTGVPIDGRTGSRADTLWDGTHLYVASHRLTTNPTSGAPSYLYRYSYDSLNSRYVLDSGFPVVINQWQTETLTIAQDSSGQLWATWVQGPSGAHQVYVNTTQGGDKSWGNPFPLPVSDPFVNNDDISAIIAFNGDQIGIMWSRQKSPAGMYFSAHRDTDTDDAWQASEVAVGGAGYADDHINLKTDSLGRVYAATKTSKTNAALPLILLSVREPSGGAWSSSTFGTVGENHSRPIVVLDQEHQTIHMFAQGPPSSPNAAYCGTIYEKTSPMSLVSFGTGMGTAVINDSSSLCLSDTSGTKQNVTSATGLVVVTGNRLTQFYWHYYNPLST